MKEQKKGTFEINMFYRENSLLHFTAYTSATDMQIVDWILNVLYKSLVVTVKYRNLEIGTKQMTYFGTIVL